MKTSIISICCILMMSILTATNALADDKECKASDHGYCINVDVVNNKKANNAQSDFCFVLQLNGSDRFASGSIPMQQLPTVLFTITKDRASIGKPLSFKIVKAQVVPSGQCTVKQASLQPVDGCDIFEYSAMTGVSRSMTLIESKNNSGFTCNIKN